MDVKWTTSRPAKSIFDRNGRRWTYVISPLVIQTHPRSAVLVTSEEHPEIPSGHNYELYIVNRLRKAMNWKTLLTADEN